MAEIVAEGLSIRRGKRVVLKDISLRAEEGELWALLGPNGAGKSTLLRALAGLHPLFEGTLEVSRLSLNGLEARRRARLLHYVPQRSTLDAPFSVEEVVRFSRYAHDTDAARDQEAVDSALADTDLLELRGRRFDQLSLGERRRVILARAIASEARVLLFDEPTASLDIRHRLSAMARLRRLADSGRTVVVALHELDDALRYADRALLLDQGREVAKGELEKVLTPRAIREVYGVCVKENASLAFSLPNEASA